MLMRDHTFQVITTEQRFTAWSNLNKTKKTIGVLGLVFCVVHWKPLNKAPVLLNLKTNCGLKLGALHLEFHALSFNKV